jgi:signal transduction histidine kinase
VAVAGGELDTRVEAGDDVDLQELASAFNQMTANLQDRIEREARFTSDVSHELRSPLTTLTATVGVLEAHRSELSPRAQSALDLLDGDLHRFTRMVDDLLEISRFDAGSAELSLDEVDPGELVRRAVMASAPVGPDGRRSTVAFPVEIGPGVEGLRLRVDKRRFERVMANLMENATLYAGGVSRVVVERRPSDPVAAPGPGSIRVIVEDHGPGVPEAERDHLFERFYRGSRAGQRSTSEGTGLGLSLVAEHVRLHGGSVSIEDAPGGGSRFIVELPLIAEDVAWDQDPV